MITHYPWTHHYALSPAFHHLPIPPSRRRSRCRRRRSRAQIRRSRRPTLRTTTRDVTRNSTINERIDRDRIPGRDRLEHRQRPTDRHIPRVDRRGSDSDTRVRRALDRRLRLLHRGAARRVRPDAVADRLRRGLGLGFAGRERRGCVQARGQRLFRFGGEGALGEAGV